jgi:hypothetical protein
MCAGGHAHPRPGGRHRTKEGSCLGTSFLPLSRRSRPRPAARQAAGSSLDEIASVTVVLADERDFQGMNEEWLKWCPSDPPARQGAKLPAKIPGLKVSIAAIAEA